MELTNKIDKKLKIAFLDFSHVFSGAEQSLFDLLSNLDKNEIEGFLYFIYPQQHQERYLNIGINFVYLESGAKWWFAGKRINKIRGSGFVSSCLLALKFAFDAKRKGISILHINLMNRKVFWWLFWSKLFGLKTIAHCRSNFWTFIPRKYLQKLCDGIICVSEHVKQMVTKYYRHKNLVVIYDPIDLAVFNTKNSIKDAKNSLKLLENRRMVASVGLLNENKGHDTAIKAFSIFASDFDNLDLLIAGGGKQNELLKLKKIVKNLNLTNRVFFTEEQIQTPELIYTASEFIYSLTKKGEAFGRVPFEAGACERVSFVPNRGAALEFFDDEINGMVVNPEDFEKIAEKSVKLLKNENLKNKIANSIMLLVKNKLSSSKYSSEISAFYKKISKF